MGLPVGEVQTAFIARYQGDTTLQGLMRNAAAPTWNIFDANSVPMGQIADYIVVQQITDKNPGTVLSMGSDATDIYTQVTIFTQAGGFEHARAIAKQINALTCRRTGAAALVLTGGFTAVWTQRYFYHEMPAPNDRSFQQVVMRFLSWISG